MTPLQLEPSAQAPWTSTMRGLSLLSWFSDMTSSLSFAYTELGLPKPVVASRPSAASAAPDPLSISRRESRLGLFISFAPLCIHLGKWAVGQCRKPVQLKTTTSSGDILLVTAAENAQYEHKQVDEVQVQLQRANDCHSSCSGI